MASSLDHEHGQPEANGINGVNGAGGRENGLLREAEDDKREVAPRTGSIEVSDLDAKLYTSEEELAERVIHGLKVAGGCIVRNVYSQQIIDEIVKELRPHLGQSEQTKGNNYLPFILLFDTKYTLQESSGPNSPRSHGVWSANQRRSL